MTPTPPPPADAPRDDDVALIAESFAEAYGLPQDRKLLWAMQVALAARASTTAGGARTDKGAPDFEDVAFFVRDAMSPRESQQEVEYVVSRIFELFAAPTSPARNDGAAREDGTAWFIVCNPREVPFQKCCPRGDSAKFIRELYEANPGARIVSLTADFDRNGPMPDDAGAHLLSLDFRAAPRVRKWHAPTSPDELREAAGALVAWFDREVGGSVTVRVAPFVARIDRVRRAMAGKEGEKL